MNIVLSLPPGWRKCARLEERTIKQACFTVPSPAVAPSSSFLPCSLFLSVMVSASWKLRGHCYLSPSPCELTCGCKKSTEALAALYGYQILMCLPTWILWRCSQGCTHLISDKQYKLSVFFSLFVCFSFSVTRSPVLVKGIQEALGVK